MADGFDSSNEKPTIPSASSFRKQFVLTLYRPTLQSKGSGTVVLVLVREAPVIGHLAISVSPH
jgi:hypothetical protein